MICSHRGKVTSGDSTICVCLGSKATIHTDLSSMRTNWQVCEGWERPPSSQRTTPGPPDKNFSIYRTNTTSLFLLHVYLRWHHPLCTESSKAEKCSLYCRLSSLKLIHYFQDDFFRFLSSFYSVTLSLRFFLSLGLKCELQPDSRRRPPQARGVRQPGQE